MAGPVPTYSSTQLAAQTAFTVPFGLITLVNTSISAATAAGLFNTTVDCSLFTAEDVSNLRIYLDSEGYLVEFAKNSSDKSLLIDWGKFLDIPGTLVTVNQGTSPWIVSGSITTSPDVNIHDSAGNSLSSTGTSLDVNVTNFPATVAVTQSTSPWIVAGTIIANQGTSPWITSVSNFPAVQTVSVNNFPATQPVSGTVTALQGTSPWVVSGTITTSPNVNVHDGAGNTISSTGTSLDVNVTDFPASQNVVVTNTPTVNQGTNPWTVAGTIIANQGTSPWVVSLASTTITGTVAVTQSTSPWVVSGTVTATPSGTQDENLVQVAGVTLGATAVTNYGTTPAATPVPGVNAFITNTPAVTLASTTITGNVTVTQATGTNLHTVVDNFPADADAYAQGSTTFGQLGGLTQAAVTTAAPTYTTGQTNPLSLTTAGALRVDGSAVTQPVSLTSTTITGNVTVVQPTGTNLHVVVDSAPSTVVTQGTSPWVISGAVTNTPPANQSINLTQVAGVTLGATAVTAYGTAPAAANVPGVNAFITNTPAVTLASTTITGNVTVTQATGTNLHTVVDNFPADADAYAQGSTTSGQLGGLTQAAVTTAAPTYTTGQTDPLSLDTAGNLRVLTGAGSTTVVTGNVTVVQPTGTNLHTVVDNFPADTDAVAIGSTTSGQLGSLSMGAVTTSAPTYVTAQTDPLSLTTTGNLRVDIGNTTWPATAAITQVSVSTVAIQLLAARVGRQRVNIFCPNSGVFIAYSTTASATVFTWNILSNNTTIEVQNYAGPIFAVKPAGGASTVTITDI